MSYNGNKYENNANGLLWFCVGAIVLMLIIILMHVFVFDEDWQREHKKNNPELYISE